MIKDKFFPQHTLGPIMEEGPGFSSGLTRQVIGHVGH